MAEQTTVQHTLTGNDEGYAIVADEDLVIDGMHCVVLIADGSLRLSAWGTVVAMHSSTVLQASIGDVVEMDGYRGRIAQVQRPGGRTGIDTQLGLEQVSA